MDSFIERCHAYRIQAEEYRNDCIEGVWLDTIYVGGLLHLFHQSCRFYFPPTEFHSQLETLMSLLVMVPPLVFTGVRLQHKDQAVLERNEGNNTRRRWRGVAER